MFRSVYLLVADRQQKNVPVGEIIDPRGLWTHMKIDRHGKAKILNQAEIQLLFSQGLQSLRDRALFAVMLYTACRVNEACTLSINDVYDRKGKVRPELIIRKGNTKGKLATRTIPVLEDLRSRLLVYRPEKSNGFLFPGRHTNSL
jgi:integrase/recombinase XerD